MAEVDFGDTELFEQLDGDLPASSVHVRFDSEGEANDVQELVSQHEETINRLSAENQELKRRLSLLNRPSGLPVEDKLDGPLLQILFMNHIISKQYHQEIEEFITSLFQKYEEHRKSNSEKTSFNIKPQPSSILLEENDDSDADTMKNIKQAFSVVGSVQYFKNFCLDKLGQPLLNENPQLTEGWDIPKYQQVFTQIVSLDGQEIQVKAKRPKPCCFNCGSEEHQMRDCPKPRDQAHINMKRKEFLDACGEAGNQNQQRYHAEEVEERFGKYKPGVISEELQEALGIMDKNLPPFIYRMRELGYPPGWLKEAELENSGLSLYDGKERLDASDGEIEDRDTEAKKHVSYDVSKLVNYPGFNISAPPDMFDEWQMFGSIPMQQAHQKDIFANYLTDSFPPGSSNKSNKRSSCQSSSSERKRQKTSGNHTVTSAVMDMDMESDEDMYHSRASKGYMFHPPLPPGSPSYGTPPPLPRGTPPSTPPNFIPPPPPTPTPPPLPKGTPPPTPNRDSPKVPPQVLDEDTWTLEELEEKQRLLWAQLDNGESTNSDCDAHTPITVSSVTSSPSRTELDIATGRKAAPRQTAHELKSPCVITKLFVAEPEEGGPLIPEEGGPLIPEEGGPLIPEEGGPLIPEEGGPLIPEEDSETNEDSNECYVVEGNDIEVNKLSSKHENASEKNPSDEDATEEAACVEPSPKRSGVPDVSKFAEGITPFEYDNMSDSTGVYLRLRGLLKNSPRNVQKSKKQV
ncbi:zinc finger CCHC domain-containing protein 8 [Xenopus laevis]|uniref:Zinc finger CCHC domain-containing protein 8 n=1 Tax=Xenopus laevis TaxID=8355 RepID=ZCHC8_XENLA|nr:zinc finger CCHC domain-containing protein 8 [Xenopus laevis]Q6DD45.1 RecName: Full=Zinc finger CCHC domain-containing protein 8; AltName: Full=TRAMP-like complex RNA-binding factor ZCCHC8 [Xenopus laevis]AAH77784.1 Zcchc8-prov protein [Xenopus laevis]